MIIAKRVIGSLLIIVGLLLGILPFILHLSNDRNDPAFKALGTGMAPIAIGVWLWQRRKESTVDVDSKAATHPDDNVFLIKLFWYTIMGAPLLLVSGIIVYFVYGYINFINK